MPPNMFNALAITSQLEKLVKERCRSGNLQLEEAVSLFNRLLQGEKNNSSIDSFNYLLISISRMKHPNRYPTVVSLFDHLYKARVAGVSPTTQTFGVVMDCCRRMGRVDLQFVVFAQLFRSGCVIDSIKFGSLIKGLCVEKRIGDAAKMFDKMSLMGCIPSLIIYNTLIDGLCSNGNTKLGLQIVERMATEGGNCKPDVFTYNTLINGLCKEKNGDFGTAFKLLDEMVVKGVVPNVVHIILSSLVSAD
ncbi:hypothetical protein LUZ60_006974 [Juncus effusus]|nr:hypothetical protein LUZ60_006974 [Juncus effusus]